MSLLSSQPAPDNSTSAQAQQSFFKLIDLNDQELLEFATRLPKIDLHYHLEGGHAVMPEILIPIAEKLGVLLPTNDPTKLRQLVQITPQDKTLIDFLRKFETIGSIFTNRAVIEEITYRTLQEADRDNVQYLELRFSPLYIAAAHSLNLRDVMDGVIAGLQRAASEIKTKVGLIVIVERQMGIEAAGVVETLAEECRDRGVVALDLANDEFHYPPGPYAGVFQRAKQAGLFTTVHAGEAAGADNVKVAIEQLGADRIGHGVRTYLDPLIEELVRTRGIALELCLTSNLQTGAVDSIEQHPFKHYLDTGIKVTLNTDDPGISGITLSSEYVKVIRQFNLSFGDLRLIAMNSVDAAFLPAVEREALRRQLLDGFAEAEKYLIEIASRKTNP